VALVATLKARLTACLAGLAASGVDVGGLTTEESADDVNDLRETLGARQLMLLAGSYGTHLAPRRRAASSRRRCAHGAAGVEGPDDTVKLPLRVDDTLNRIDAAHPGLVASIRTLLERLRREPWTKTLPNGQAVTVGPWDLQRRGRRVARHRAGNRRARSGHRRDAAGGLLGLIRWTIPFRMPRAAQRDEHGDGLRVVRVGGAPAQVREQAPAALLGDAMNVPLPGVCDVPACRGCPTRFERRSSRPFPRCLSPARSTDARRRRMRKQSRKGCRMRPS
jgi:hypothetical protein